MISVFSLVILIVVGLIIWGLLSEDLKEGLGSIGGVVIEVIWFIVWLLLFQVFGLTITFSFNG